MTRQFWHDILASDKILSNLGKNNGIMSFRDFANSQREGMRALATTGVMGLHLVSGPAVGFGIGYGLDAWLETTPWCGFAFLLIGFGAGFLNVWRDAKVLIRKN